MAESTVENPAFYKMVTRMIRASGRRSQEGDLTDLAALMEMQTILDETIAVTVNSLRENDGYSWADIAAATGMSKMGAHKRWAKRND